MNQICHNNKMIECPLCAGDKIAVEGVDKTRTYYVCSRCGLLFIRPGQRLDAASEKSRYNLHQNSPDNEGYVHFLKKLFAPVNELLSQNQSGLDFGCGPGPTLHLLFEKAGHQMTLYDHFYYPNEAVFEKAYDFITASEVLEHLFTPRQALIRLWSCLSTGGILGIMTKFVTDAVSIDTWHYKNDDTHVCFYSTKTFEFLARQWQADVTFLEDIAIFKKT